MQNDVYLYNCCEDIQIIEVWETFKQELDNLFDYEVFLTVEEWFTDLSKTLEWPNYSLLSLC